MHNVGGFLSSAVENCGLSAQFRGKWGGLLDREKPLVYNKARRGA